MWFSFEQKIFITILLIFICCMSHSLARDGRRRQIFPSPTRQMQEDASFAEEKQRPNFGKNLTFDFQYHNITYEIGTVPNKTLQVFFGPPKLAVTPRTGDTLSVEHCHETAIAVKLKPPDYEERAYYTIFGVDLNANVPTTKQATKKYIFFLQSNYQFWNMKDNTSVSTTDINSDDYEYVAEVSPVTKWKRKFSYNRKPKHRPEYFEGYHRILFLLYKQPRAINVSRYIAKTEAGRQNITRFVKFFKLEGPLAGNVFSCLYQQSLGILRSGAKQSGYPMISVYLAILYIIVNKFA